MPSFVEDISAAVDALGVEPAGIIWGIGMTHWDSADQRNAFLATIAQKA